MSSPALRRGAGAGLLAFALMCTGLPARAGDRSEKQLCSQAYVQGQRLRNKHRLVEANKQFLVCARDACPTVLRKDCVQWSVEAAKAIPTVVVEASDARGRDLVDVRVTLDGRSFVERIDGHAMPVDPGVHTFTFETDGTSPISRRMVIHEAEQNRHLHVTFPIGRKAPPEQPHVSSGTPLAVYVLGGVGLVGLGGFTYMAVKFDHQVGELDKCKGHCAQSSVDAASRTRTLSFIPLGIGVASLGVAAYLYFSHQGSAQRDAEQGRLPRLDVEPVHGGAVTSLCGRF
jgi:hypothetical protein